MSRQVTSSNEADVARGGGGRAGGAQAGAAIRYTPLHAVTRRYAQAALKLEPLFVKGYLHLAKVQLQLGQAAQAKETVQGGLRRLQEEGQPRAPALEELLQTILQAPDPPRRRRHHAVTAPCARHYHHTVTIPSLYYHAVTMS